MLLLLLPVALAASPLDGRWVLSSDLAAAQAAQRASADRALASLPSLLRPLGEHLLAPTFRICASYVFQLSPDAFRVQCEDSPPLSGPLDGVARPILVAGEERPVSLARQGEGVVLTIRSDNGARVTTYTPAPGGPHVHVAISSSHLDLPVSWDLDYRAAP